MVTQLRRWGGVLAVLGGLLWIAYGIFEMTEPWGRDTVYSDEKGYEIIINTNLFVLYSLPGALALLLTSLGLVGMLTLFGQHVSRSSNWAHRLGSLAAVLGVLSLLGVLIRFDPLFTTTRIFGTLILGVATLVAGLSGRRRQVDEVWSRGLPILGVLGMFLFPLWPLVYAVQWIPEVLGAVIIGVFGISWIVIGYRLSTSRFSRVVQERGVR